MSNNETTCTKGLQSVAGENRSGNHAHHESIRLSIYVSATKIAPAIKKYGIVVRARLTLVYVDCRYVTGFYVLRKNFTRTFRLAFTKFF